MLYRLYMIVNRLRRSSHNLITLKLVYCVDFNVSVEALLRKLLLNGFDLIIEWRYDSDLVSLVAIAMLKWLLNNDISCFFFTEQHIFIQRITRKKTEWRKGFIGRKISFLRSYRKTLWPHQYLNRCTHHNENKTLYWSFSSDAATN